MILIRKTDPIHLTVHQPSTKASREQLARHISQIHADAVLHRINGLNCPEARKTALRKAIADAVRKRSGEQF